MTRAPWLADVLRDAGLEVIELPGWHGRGRDMRSIDAVVLHETVTPPSWADSRVAAMLRDGHSTLAGPLYQLGLDRQGRFWLIADGRCNHNGFGRFGNDSIGIGTFANGAGNPKEPWNTTQRETAAAGAAAICAHLGLPASRVQGHKETDPGRKQDPYRVDMAALRRRVEQQAAPDPWEAFMAELTEKEQDVVKSFARQLVRMKTTGDSFARQLLTFHREERPVVQEIISHIRGKGTSVQGLIRGATNLFRHARDVEKWPVDTR